MDVDECRTLHTPILSAILGVKMNTKELTPKMVEMVDTHFAEVRSVLCKGSIDETSDNHY